MRFSIVVLSFSAIAVGLPSAEPQDEAAVMIKAKMSGLSSIPVLVRSAEVEEREADVPILDARIDAHEKEGRSVNLSPMNNAEHGKKIHRSRL